MTRKQNALIEANEDENKRLSALIEMLVKAIEPIGVIADELLSEAPAEATLFKLMTSASGDHINILLDDLRSVSSALTAAKQEGF